MILTVGATKMTCACDRRWRLWPCRCCARLGTGSSGVWGGQVASALCLEQGLLGLRCQGRGLGSHGLISRRRLRWGQSGATNRQRFAQGRLWVTRHSADIDRDFAADGIAATIWPSLVGIAWATAGVCARRCEMGLFVQPYLPVALAQLLEDTLRCSVQ